MENLSRSPLAKILNHLNLEDRIKLRVVSRNWRNCVDHHKVTSLCYSEQKRSQIYGKKRWINGKFDRNFVASAKFDSFFSSFNKSILSRLQHLRLCSLTLNDCHSLVRTLNSFRKLEELDLINLRLRSAGKPKLSLPNLKRVWIENSSQMGQLTLDAPKLHSIKLLDCDGLKFEVVQTTSVQSIVISTADYLKVERFFELKHLCCLRFPGPVSDKLLLNLWKLDTIHVYWRTAAANLCSQRKKYGRQNLKIYFHDILVKYVSDLEPLEDKKKRFARYVEHRAKLAAEIKGHQSIKYSDLEAVVSTMPDDPIWTRFADLSEVWTDEPVKHTEQFLRFLKSHQYIATLQFESSQPQVLFDRLPGHCSIQKLALKLKPSDLEFLFKLKDLIDIWLGWKIDGDLLRRVFAELKFVTSFRFHDRLIKKVQRNRSKLSVTNKTTVTVNNINEAIHSLGL